MTTFATVCNGRYDNVCYCYSCYGSAVHRHSGTVSMTTVATSTVVISTVDMETVEE